MKSSQSPSKPAAVAKPAPYCGYPGCREPAPLKCSRYREVHYCSKNYPTDHWKLHKKLCVAPSKKKSAILPPAAPILLKGSAKEEEDDEDTCIVCLEHIANANLRPCGHSATCKGCTEELMNLKEPCPLCRKPISGMDIGKWQSPIGKHGLWPTSLKNLSELARGEGFNEYLRKQFNGNETAYLSWKEVFDVLEIGNARVVGPDLPLEQQVLMITKSEDLVKLRALAKLCSREFFDDPSLLVVAWRRILEVLELAMPVAEKKKARGKKKQKKKNDSRKLESLDVCAALGKA
ncbi:hypothetical protein TL16_g05706 [Triparma laevis f. inornata]|uniref:RING-type domain-containing protein n=1 Tax=Triparma laevis f. inornata TaxID=1714386 RepID=A0A9W7ANN7_9STRA|nr:hypothetical protein TL16_g05706 [Triparma laevis f. inornata]